MPVSTERAAAARGEEPVLRRFTVVERWVHWGTAVLMGVMLITAACLYVPWLAELVGRRRLVVGLHEWAGLALPVPLLVGLVSRALRADLGRLNRFGPHDRGWVRAALRGHRRPAGKFNAGQKLYAALLAGAALVLLGTGLVLWFPGLVPVLWRTGATFVHDWTALLIGVLVVGHIGMAARDAEARRALRTGYVSRAWARREHSLWERES
ncbi:MULTISPECIES: cytochrome b/b6 domain-containing protein [unclassified Streptomyces]|uniref:cytochrome b/b6 domain-containing protein n=1 Tax=unclassified Streptomyces TaxID=2593676 RepID=UPI00068515A8|nr:MULTISPECIES: cytochrome b/b6 domain-containing protein [unclassified Streptomyces]MYT33200.1 formate dehydrogenase [Streptomyces sp. SID8354]